MSQAIVAYHWFDPDVKPLTRGSSSKSSDCNRFHLGENGADSASRNEGSWPENRSTVRYFQALAAFADPP